jgi:exonuclease III
MDLLRWNVNDIHTRLPDLEAVMQYHNPDIICLQETHLHSTHSLNFHDLMAYNYNHIGSDSASGGTPITFQSPLQASTIHLTLTNLVFTLCNIYLSPAIPMDQGELSHLFSQLPPPFNVLGDFNSKNILCGLVLTNKMGRIISEYVMD